MFCFQYSEMIELGSVEEGSSLVEELIELTSQSLCRLEIKEHFNIVKEIGRGKYGRVMLVTHLCKGKVPQNMFTVA